MSPSSASNPVPPAPGADGPFVLRRIDPARRMARFYTLSVELTLFQDWSCRREHGRIGSRGGRVMIGLYPRKDEALAALSALLKAKRRRGYQVVEGEGPERGP